jgi:hypothetical protein
VQLVDFDEEVTAEDNLGLLDLLLVLVDDLFIGDLQLQLLGLHFEGSDIDEVVHIFDLHGLRLVLV